jgi:hypothetical protein
VSARIQSETMDRLRSSLIALHEAAGCYARSAARVKTHLLGAELLQYAEQRRRFAVELVDVLDGELSVPPATHATEAPPLADESAVLKRCAAADEAVLRALRLLSESQLPEPAQRAIRRQAFAVRRVVERLQSLCCDL